MIHGYGSARSAFRLGLAGAASFCVSLALPAFTMSMIGKPTEFEGWRAALISLDALGESLITLQSPGWAFFVAGGAALCNSVLIAAPLLFRSVKPKRWAPRLMAALSALGLLLGLLSPHLIDGVRPLVGYELWLAAFSCVLLASLLARRAT